MPKSVPHACWHNTLPLPADRAVFKRLTSAFVEMFLSPADEILPLCGLAFPAVWGCLRAAVGMMTRNLSPLFSGLRLSPQCQGNGPSLPHCPGNQLLKETSVPCCFKARGWAKHTWEPHLFSQGGRRGPREVWLLLLLQCLSKIPQMGQLRRWVLQSAFIQPHFCSFPYPASPVRL